MKGNRMLRNQEGFTLVEIIAVLIILGILAAVAVPRYIDLEENAKERAIDAAISELNGRESLMWADKKISQSGWISDTQVWNELIADPDDPTVPDLGDAYTWVSLPSPDATSTGELSFKNASPGVTLQRIPSTDTSPATWKKPTS